MIRTTERGAATTVTLGACDASSATQARHHANGVGHVHRGDGPAAVVIARPALALGLAPALAALTAACSSDAGRLAAPTEGDLQATRRRLGAPRVVGGCKVNRAARRRAAALLAARGRWFS